MRKLRYYILGDFEGGKERSWSGFTKGWTEWGEGDTYPDEKSAEAALADARESKTDETGSELKSARVSWYIEMGHQRS